MMTSAAKRTGNIKSKTILIEILRCRKDHKKAQKTQNIQELSVIMMDHDHQIQNDG